MTNPVNGFLKELSRATGKLIAKIWINQELLIILLRN